MRAKFTVSFAKTFVPARSGKFLGILVIEAEEKVLLKAYGGNEGVMGEEE